MQVQIIKEEGWNEALDGISMSFNSDRDMEPIAIKLSKRSLHGGENKFLEAIGVWMLVDAPRYWWQQFDTYRVGVTKQSESTMHTIMRTPFSQHMFDDPIHPDWIEHLEALRVGQFFEEIKAHLPESFLQTRMVFTNYKAIRHIISQRKSHRLRQWQQWCKEVVEQLAHPEYIHE